MLITDGEPDSGQDLTSLGQEIKTKVDGKGFSFFAVGVEGYNHKKLSQIAYPNPPLKLQGLEFSALFTWLSASISMVSKSAEGQTVSLPPVTSWAQIEV